MIIRYLFIIFIGLCAGGFIAAGFFAFITSIGIITGIAARTRTQKFVRLYESMVVYGSVAGTVVWNTGWWFGPERGTVQLIFLALCGHFYGIFTGCLLMALAETVKGIPIFYRRIKLKNSILCFIVGMALGKLAGNLLFTFFFG